MTANVATMIDNIANYDWFSQVGQDFSFPGSRMADFHWIAKKIIDSDMDYKPFGTSLSADEHVIDKFYFDNSALDEQNEIYKSVSDIKYFTDDFLFDIDEEYAEDVESELLYYPGSYTYPHELVDYIDPKRFITYALLEANAQKWGCESNVFRTLITIYENGHALLGYDDECKEYVIW